IFSSSLTLKLDSFLGGRPPINNPKEMAQHMARLAHLMGYIINNTLKAEIATGSLHAQLIAFRENLIPELSVGQFADMYAQTIAYGLFAARCETDNGKDFTRQNAAYLIPKTNPFLRKLFNHIAGPGLDEQLVGAVDDLAQILAQSGMESILKGFGKSAGKDDPVVHFYETFLKEYAPKTREMRGVYYTPLPVVSYIVRSIDHILKTRFGKLQGLADPSVLVLDPAVGTATFLYVVMQEIHDAVIKQGQTGMWNDYVAERLLKRIFGFELLMAPYAVAHLKLGLLLRETGYKFQSDERLGIYLTNTLEDAFKKSELLPGFNKYIVDEANAAAEIKKEKPIMVVLGNPPYSVVSANTGKWITELINGFFDTDGHEMVKGYKTVDGQPLGEKNPKVLNDDYVKFIRFGQWRIERTGKGILGFITNHGYLDNPTFRGMRQALINTFTDIYILNLHGNSKRKEICPDGGKDENVFDIQQGVAIGIFVKEDGKTGTAKVHYADMWGLRENKYHTLSETSLIDTNWLELTPNSPFYLFVPQDEEFRLEYDKGWEVTNIFPINSVGIVTSRDHFAIDMSIEQLNERISLFRNSTWNDDETKERFELSDTEGWNVANARKNIRLDEEWHTNFKDILYRPFDNRYIFFHDSVVERSRHNVMRHMLSNNIAFITTRQVTSIGFNHVICTSSSIEYKSISHDRNSYIFPLYLYPGKDELQFEKRRRPNLNPEFIKAVAEKLGLKFIEDGKGDLNETFGPEDIFNYAYAVFHSPTYRTRYAEFLKIDFPRLPFTSNKELLKSLAERGAELVSLHLMESSLLELEKVYAQVKFNIPGSSVIEKVRYDEKAQRVYLNKEQHFEGISPEVWNFHIGGYQVCDKWLKDRQKMKRKLTIDEAQHYQKIVVALKETIRLMAEIDSVIPQWPID
ncbi:type ISP restriction/modification enzyme, partial [Chloroflexota bacterium]